VELKVTLRLNDELERARKEALLQYLTTGSEEVPQTLARLASFLTRYRNADIMDWLLLEIFIRNVRYNNSNKLTLLIFLPFLTTL
jgi:hypothetical protein